jgi:hypothetical protein
MVSFNGAEDKTGVSNLLASAGTSKCKMQGQMHEWGTTGAEY